MDFVGITIHLLKILASFAGSYGLAIIILTIAMRMVMWPLSDSQQRSMRAMQTLSPKMKEIQTRYQSDPQTMQRKMMEFYKEHKFNPFSGCFPILIQMPIFILLYSSLMSPQFMQTAGNQSFLFINRLDTTMRSHSGTEKDGAFGVQRNDTFALSDKIKLVFDNGTTTEAKIEKPKNALQIQGSIEPTKPIDFKLPLDSIKLSFSELDKIKTAEVAIIDNSTKEVEDIKFTRRDNLLVAEVPTTETKTTFHYDVLFLVILFGATMWLSQKVMTASNKNVAVDPTQQAMQQSMGTMMPITITAMFVFFPIPAGVLLYLIVSNIIQILQTYVINKQIDKEEELKKASVTTSDVKNAKPIQAKKVNDITK